MLAALGLAFGLGIFVPAAKAQDDSTSKKVWLLELKPGRARRVLVGREPNGQRYWYLPFTLTNKESTAHSFFLEIWSESDKGRQFRSIDESVVVAKARKRLGLDPGQRLWSQPDFTTAHAEQPLPPTFPTELRLPRIGGGETVQCIAVFHGPDAEMDKMVVKVRGLTNDVEVKRTDNAHERVLRQRVLVLHYRRPGDEFYAQEDPIEFLGRTWEVLEERVKTDLD